MTEAPPRIALEFLDALSRRDFDALARSLSDDVWLRALLPRKLVESRTREGALATLREWYASATDFEVVETAHHSVEAREFLLYRFRLRPEWAPDEPHVIEQAGFCRVRDGRIRRLDLVCTGFHPVEDESSKGKSSTEAA